jgi:hypothetical protein
VPGDPDDPAATIPPGFWARDLALAGASLSDGSSLAGWLTPSQARPAAVHGFSLLLVSGHGRDRSVVRVPLDARHDASVSGRILRRLVDRRAELVGAVVVHHDPTETVTASAPYALRANGVLQPGG